MLLLGGGIVISHGYDVTREETVLNMGLLDLKATTRQHVSIPAHLGWALVASGALVLTGGALSKHT